MSKFLLLAAGLTVAIPLIAFAGLGLTRKGYDGPEFKLVKKEDGFEIRDYSAMVLVSTEMDADEGDGGFMRLFRYIDKGNEKNQKIAMTTPVFIEGSRKDGKMSFVVPKDVAETGAPAPNAEDVNVGKMEPARFAVLRFKGSKSAKAASKAEETLRKSLSENGYKVVPGGKALLAYYDPPWTPEALRKNEVLLQIEVEARE